MSKSNGTILSHEAEQDVIGALLHQPHLFHQVAAILRHGDLIGDEARIAYAAIQRVMGNGAQFANHEHIIDQIKTDGGLARCPLVWLQSASDRVADPSNAPYYASLVRQSADRCRLLQAAELLVNYPDEQSVEKVKAAWQSRYRPLDPAAPPNPFTFHTATEFDALDLRRDYHVPGILAAGPVPTMFSGAFKTLKTSIVLDLLVSLASGTSFLDHFGVPRPVRCGVMSGESGAFAIQGTIRRIVRSKGILMSGVGDMLRICTAVPSLSDAAHTDAIERFIAESEIKVLTIDPTYLAMRGLGTDDAGSMFRMAAFLDPLARIGERTGCTPILVHHNSRGATRANPNEPAELADIAWSGFAEWAGQWILLARRERYNPDSNGEHALWLTAGGRDGHSTLVGVNVTEGRQDDPDGRRWEVEIEPAAEARRDTADSVQKNRDQERQLRQERNLDADKATIRQVLNNISGDTKSGIRDRTSLNTSRFNAAFAALLNDQAIESVEVQKSNGQKYTGFRLALGLTRTHSDSSLGLD